MVINSDLEVRLKTRAIELALEHHRMRMIGGSTKDVLETAELYFRFIAGPQPETKKKK